MIVTKLISGLGNQLFQYTVGRQLSILNNTSLQLDTSFYTSQNTRSYKLNHFNIQANIATATEVKKLTAASNPSFIRKTLNKIPPAKPKYKSRYFKESKWWIYEPDIWKVGPDTYVDGYWQNYLYYTNLNEKIWDELTLKLEDNDPNTVIRQQIMADSNSISLHIRRGDYVLNKAANSMMGVLPLTYYEMAINHLLKVVPDARFYIFSDDLAWAKEFLPEAISKTFVEIGDGSYDYLELDLMSKCRHHIIANSSFSWWGAFLNRYKAKQVVAPKNWVAQPEINKIIYIQMPGWMLM
jgi:hypothetical protein